MQKSLDFFKWTPIWMIVAAGVLIFGTGVVWASYSIFTIKGEIMVLEAISVDEPLTYSVSLYANEVDNRVFTLRNAGSEPVHVELHKTINPADGHLQLELSDEEITVPGHDFVKFYVIASADNDVIPKPYFIEVEVTRGGG